MNRIKILTWPFLALSAGLLACALPSKPQVNSTSNTEVPTPTEIANTAPAVVPTPILCSPSLTKVTDRNGFDGGGRWSPDNRQILFGRIDNRNNSQIYLREIQSGLEVPITDSSLLLSGVSLGSWSPDGEEITFFYLKTDSDIAVEPTRFYLTIRTLGDLINEPFDPREWQSPNEYLITMGFSPEWAPFENKILFGYDPYENGQYYIALFVIDLDTLLVNQLTPSELRTGGGRWSPDGTQIAFSSDVSGDQELFMMNADGSNIRQLTDNTFDDIWPVWSPDGKYLGFSTNRNDSWDIYTLALETREEIQITDNPQNEVVSDWGSNDFMLLTANWGSTAPPSISLPIVTPFDEIYMIRSCLGK